MTSDGTIITRERLETLLATGQWELTSISQVIDGESYWQVVNDQDMKTLYVPMKE